MSSKAEITEEELKSLIPYCPCGACQPQSWLVWATRSLFGHNCSVCNWCLKAGLHMGITFTRPEYIEEARKAKALAGRDSN